MRGRSNSSSRRLALTIGTSSTLNDFINKKLGVKKMKTIYELSVEELEELRERYIIEFDIDHDNISDEEVRQYYVGTSFVEEDFFCNIKN